MRGDSGYGRPPAGPPDGGPEVPAESRPAAESRPVGGPQAGQPDDRPGASPDRPSGAAPGGVPGASLVRPSGAAPGASPVRPPGGEPDGPPDLTDPAADPAHETTGRITRSRWYRRLAPHLHRARSTATGALVVRLAITTLGAAVIVTGIILLPLPGPGWLIIFIGLAILSLEYTWARRVLRFARVRVRKWDTWVRGRTLPVRALIGVALALFVLAVMAAAIEWSLGQGTLARWWHTLTP
jgi:uncharacterized protein (TIGR02611 family)